MNGREDSDLSVPDVKQRAFNKGIRDLRLLSALEWYIAVARIEGDYNWMIEILTSWINRLSPEIAKFDAQGLKNADTDLENARALMTQGNREDARELINKVERFLYQAQNKLGIDNPEKAKDFLSEERWS